MRRERSASGPCARRLAPEAEARGAIGERCPLCGSSAAPEAAGCRACALARWCGLTMACPRCGYRYPPESSLTRWWRRWRARAARRTVGPADPPEKAGQARGAHPLPRLGLGERARIVSLVPQDPRRLARLVGLGVVPGARVLLRQKHPAVVISVGETLIALDANVAEGIYVRRADSGGEG